MSRVVFAFLPRATLAALTVLCVVAHSPQLLAAGSWVSISGSPAVTASVGSAYSFTPAVSPASAQARFSVGNKPAWATFNRYTGKLSGTPSAAGTFTGIRISVTEWRASASLPPFSITVAAAGGGATNSKPTISGSPATAVNAGDSYTFTPTASDANNDKLTFRVQNLPSWAAFSASTGTLSGQPTSATVGTYTNIVVSVSDGTASASLAPFSIAVNQTSNGSAQINWSPPTQNTDGSALTNLSGYRINYGTSQTNLSNSIQIPNPGIASYVVTNLSGGTWYFDVVAYNSSGTQSAASTLGSKTIP
jgi:Putative Ig domain